MRTRSSPGHGGLNASLQYRYTFLLDTRYPTMAKVKISTQVNPFPMPVTLVGSLVDGKPNFFTAAWINRGDYTPPCVMVAMNPKHHTTRGVKDNGTFSVNVPGKKHVIKTDYCGINSGKDVDKSKLFNVFYGKTETAPMIEGFPLNLECKLMKEIEMGFDHIFIGEIVDAYAEESFIKDGKIDLVSMEPFVLMMANGKYHLVGRELDDAWGAGKKYKA